MRIELRAVITCEYQNGGRFCTETDSFTGDPESVTLEDFAAKATAFFRSLGWVCRRPGSGPHNLCPHHHPKVGG